MDPSLKQKTQERLTKAENIIVCAPLNADFDHKAASLALYLSILKIGKNARVLAKEPTVEEAQKLYGIDKISSSSKSTDNFVIAINDAVNSVDKVTYFLEKDKLKIVVHPLAGSTGINKEQITFDNAPAKPDFVIAVGFSSKEELRKEFAQEQIFDPETWIISINKSPDSQKFAQVNISSTQVSSISEMCTQLIQELALPLNEDIAYNLYTGLSFATRGFSPAQTSPLTFQVAAWLLKFGAGRASFAKKAQKTESDFAPQQKQYSQEEQYTTLQTLPGELPGPEETPLEEVEVEKSKEEDWLKPPKVYKGSKSFDSES
ncbi:hypothetical protein HY382_00175 [Candidatus Curtissbacteria bacterium]|nr:hypothetical protein [Candidatus Curtissbacteria bacterium]